MTAALIAQRGLGPDVQIRAEVDAAVVVLNGQLRHAALRLLLDGGLRTLSESWHLPDRDFRTLESSSPSSAHWGPYENLPSFRASDFSSRNFRRAFGGVFAQRLVYVPF